MPALVQSVQRAVALLQVLGAQNRPTTLGQLAEAVGLAKGTAHGLVQTLCEVGFVEQDPESGRYFLGAGLLQLGSAEADPNVLRGRAMNWTDALARRTGEAVLLGAREDGAVLIAHHVFRPGSTRVAERQTSLTGTWRPLHATALGKVLLAHDRGALVALRGRELESFTFRTVTDERRLRGELADVRDHGWAAEVEEREPGVAAVAAPVRDRSGFVVAAVGVEGDVDKVCDTRYRPRPELLSAVTAAARSISRELGHGSDR